MSNNAPICTATLLLCVFLAGCTGDPNSAVSGKSDTWSEVPDDPLPRIVDNAPGENHFDTVVQLTDGGVNRAPLFLENGRRVLFSSIRPPHSDARSYTMFVDTSGLREESEEITQPALSVRDAKSEEEIRCFTALMGTGGRGVFSGRLPHSEGSATEVFVAIGSGEPRRVSQEGQTAGAPALTPDGRYLVYTGETSKGEFDLYVHDLEQGLTEKITTAAGFDGDAAFSKDGKRLLFVSQRSDADPEEYNIFVADWLLTSE